jgi:hypothetical protein
MTTEAMVIDERGAANGSQFQNDTERVTLRYKVFFRYGEAFQSGRVVLAQSYIHKVLRRELGDHISIE